MRASAVAASSRRLLMLCSRPVSSLPLSVLPSSLSSSSSSSSSSLPVLGSLLCRHFAMVATPVDRSAVSADGVYRRPPVPFPRAPLSEHDELVWHDGTAPEPCLDRYDHVIAPRRALAMLLSAIGLIYGGAYVVARVVNVAPGSPRSRSSSPTTDWQRSSEGCHQQSQQTAATAAAATSRTTDGEPAIAAAMRLVRVRAEARERMRRDHAIEHLRLLLTVFIQRQL